MDGRLLAIDAGWPCSLRKYQRKLKEAGYKFDNISWVAVTHFHMDHAGLLGEFQALGITCFIFETQIGAIDDMERIIQKNKEYGAYRVGVEIETIETPGHSEDSISFLTEGGEAIVGDLYPPNQIMEDDVESGRSWDTLKREGLKRFIQVMPLDSI